MKLEFLNKGYKIKFLKKYKFINLKVVFWKDSSK